MKRAAQSSVTVNAALFGALAILGSDGLWAQGLAERLLGGGAVSRPDSVSASTDFDAAETEDADGDFFTENLDPYGSWVEVAGYGRCWRPLGLSEGWRPYSEGYWAYTDAGWTWVSYEPFGSVVYHYGRWLRLTNVGWVWVPGREWGPAWVSWRYGDEYVGWAPLPPAARWRSETGISTWVDVSAGIGPGHYQFCAVRDFGTPLLSRVIVSSANNSLFVQITQNVTNITIYNRRPFCGGPRYDWLAARCQRPVPRLRLVCEERVDRIRERAYLEGNRDGFNAGLFAGREADVLVMPAPRAVNVESAVSKGDRPVRRVDAAGVDSGWRGVPERDRRQVESAMVRDAAGLTPAVAPARKPGIEELKSAPKPVGVLEKREVLSKGGVRPVSEPRLGVVQEGKAPPVAVVGREEARPANGDSVLREPNPKTGRNEGVNMIRRDSGASIEPRRMSTTMDGVARVDGAAFQGRAVSGERVVLDSAGRNLGGGEASSIRPEVSATGGVPPVGVAPTKGALSGLKDQDRRALDMNRQADQFARERSAAQQGAKSTLQAGGSPRILSDSARSVGQSETVRPSQALFDRQRLEQQRMANEQANRERLVRMQSGGAVNQMQRVGQPSQPLQPLPANVRPPQPQGPQPMAGAGTPKSAPNAPTGGSSAKKKEDEVKR